MADDAPVGVPEDGAPLAEPIPDPIPDDPYILGENPSVVDSLWVITRIILATLLILVGFALVVGIVFRLT